MGADFAGHAGRGTGLGAERAPNASVERFRRRLLAGPRLLYAILDFELVPASQREALGLALLAAGVDALQLRAKQEGPRALAALGAQLLPAARRLGIPLLINDRVDVALRLGADGVHLGAGDLPAEAARRLLGGEPLIGCTAHDLRELQALDARAELDGIDYVGFGSVYPTGTKKDAVARGVAALTPAVAATRLPLVAIGGIQPQGVAALLAAGIRGVAAASALSQPARVPGAVQAFRAALAG